MSTNKHTRLVCLYWVQKKRSIFLKYSGTVVATSKELKSKRSLDQTFKFFKVIGCHSSVIKVIGHRSFLRHWNQQSHDNYQSYTQFIWSVFKLGFNPGLIVIKPIVKLTKLLVSNPEFKPKFFRFCLKPEQISWVLIESQLCKTLCLIISFQK